MKLRTKLTAILMCLCTLLLCLTMGFVLKGVSASADTNAPVEAPAGENPESWTKVPESQMKALSNDPTTFSQFFAVNQASLAPRFRYTPAEGENYTLSNVTDIAFRVRNSGRQRNNSNTSAGITFIEFKFKESETVWNLKNQQKYTDETYTHLVGITPKGGYNRKIGIAPGNATKGGMLSFPAGMDTTVYIPLTFIYNDDSTQCITSVAGYENWTLEYIEFEQSTYRWDMQVGQIALVQTLSQADSDNGNSYTYPQTVMNFTKSEIENTNGRLAERAYDNVCLTVNNTQATLTDGKLTAAIEGIGTVSVDPTLLWYTSASITSDLAEGYGITGITVQAMKDGEVANVPALSVASIEDGYTFALSQSFRVEGKLISDDQLWADTSEYGPIEMSINITVEKLVKLTLTGDMADYVQVTYGSHTAQDGVLYLASDVSSVLTVVAKSGGGTLTGVKLGGEELTPAEGTSDYTVRITEDTQLEVIGVGDPATVTVDLEKATHTGVSVDGTAITEGKEISTNEREVIVIVLSPETGYRGILEKVVTLPSAEEDEEVATAEV
ncbi:MAG: hypothetical protein ACI4ST_03300, partial [Candidatus Gallimonas sp.]